MPEKTPAYQSLTPKQMLDLLLDALLERQTERGVEKPPAADATRESPGDRAKPASDPLSGKAGKRSSLAQTVREATRQTTPPQPIPGGDVWEPPARLPPIHLEKMLARFLLLVVVLIIAVNVPVNRYGVSLARMMPESASLIIRDGLVLKGGGPRIYVLEKDRLRWVSSLDAFDHLGLSWGDVHVVEDSFLDRFEQGTPVHVLLKCASSPHIYRLENNKKRWIKDIDTFLAEGHVWDDVRIVFCEYLRAIPDGLPIPENAGSPPQP
jgi:hypothetical protein